MICIILYCIVCYLFNIGAIINIVEDNVVRKGVDVISVIIIFILSPIMIPIVLGYNYRNNDR